MKEKKVKKTTPKKLQPVTESPKTPPMTATERKRNQRERDKARGMVETTVIVPLSRVDEIRQIAASMRSRKKRSDAGIPKSGGVAKASKEAQI